MRTISPIQYKWVKHLIQKLHEVDVYMLSTSGEVEEKALAAAEAGICLNVSNAYASITYSSTLPPVNKVQRIAPVDTARRNDDTSIAAARERFLARKRARTGK